MAERFLGEILAPLANGQGSIHLTDNWMQGRTAYGGASAAAALSAALAHDPDLPPLRSAQIAFVGPLAEDIELRPSILRKGRSATFVRVEAWSGGALGLNATFLSAIDRESRVDQRPATIDPPQRGAILPPPPFLRFAHNFEVASAGPDKPGRWLRWGRITHSEGLDPAVALVAVADILPPAALGWFGGPLPLSTMSWQIDLLSTDIGKEGDWLLLDAIAAHCEHGLSAQHMRIWDQAGRPIAHARQTVALFG